MVINEEVPIHIKSLKNPHFVICAGAGGSSVVQENGTKPGSTRGGSASLHDE